MPDDRLGRRFGSPGDHDVDSDIEYATVLNIAEQQQGENHGINRYSDFQTPAENKL
jgi:hypothetical protein